MKLKVCFAIFLLLFSVPAFAELTDADLEKLEAMFRESEIRMDTVIRESEARLKEHIGQEFAKVHIKLDALDKRMDEGFDDLNKRMDEGFDRLEASLDRNFLMLWVLVAVFVIFVGIPYILLALFEHRR